MLSVTSILSGSFASATSVIAAENQSSVEPTYAQTVNEEVVAIENVNDAEMIAKINEQLSTMMENYKNDKYDDVIMNDNGIALTSTAGDSYEANNGPGVATTGRYNKVTYGTIHEADDVDWYKIEVTDIDNPISVILTNIPNNCDYDMFLVQYDSTNGITAMYNNLQTGTTSEELYGYVNAPGTYYVVIQPDTSVENNFNASSNYKLYIGDYYRTGGYGWQDTGIEIKFGYYPTGNTTNVYSNWYSYNLTNNTSIPENAILNKFYLDSNGNGAYYAGFYKALAAYGQNYRFADKLGGIEVMYSGDDEFWVKQDWRIGGYLMVSYSFVWEPRVLLTYKFPATIQNLRFL